MMKGKGDEMKMKKRLIAMAMAAMMMFSLAGCAESGGENQSSAQSIAETETGSQTAASETEGGSAAGTEEVFTIGVCIPLSGANAAYGAEAMNALELGVEQINAEGGFNGVPVELLVYDSQNSAEEAVKATTKLIEVEQVDAYIGSVNSGEMLAVADYLNEHKIYSMGMGTSPSWMKPEHEYIFRAARNDDKTVPLTADIAEKLDFNRIGVFYGQDDASIVTAEAFMEECENRGIEICAEESYDMGDTDYSGQIANILAANPDCVYIAVTGEPGPLIVKQLRSYGYTGIILDRESFMAAQIDIAGEENSNYIAFAIPYVTYESVDQCDDPYMKEFLQAYLDKYGEMVKTDSAYRAYDTITVMWEAAKIAGKNDSDSLKDATNQISGLQGLGGTMDYTSGNREGYNTFGSFILIDRKNIPLDQWIEDGGYEAYKEATGNAK